MTAFCIITTPDEVVVATDGGSYGANGSLDTIAGKVILVPEASTVITGRGMILAFDELTLLVHKSNVRLDFDTILQVAPLFIERAAARLVSLGHHDERFEYCIAGWSEGRQAHEAWRVRSYERDGVAAGVPHRLPECHLSNTVPPITASDFGLKMPETGACQWRREPFKWAALAIAALRFCPTADPGTTRGKVVVGAFVQVTRISRHAVASEIVQEWPDPAGQPIDPEASLENLRGAELRRGIFGMFEKWSDNDADR